MNPRVSITMLLVSTFAVAQEEVQVPVPNKLVIRQNIEVAPGYPSSIETINYEVLDVDLDAQVLSFRHEYALPVDYGMGDEPETLPHFCTYPGLRDRAAGVILGIYDLKKGAVREYFHVYRSTYKKSECSTAKQAKETLARAKAAFAGLKLGWEPSAFTKRGISFEGYPSFLRGLGPAEGASAKAISFFSGPGAKRSYYFSRDRVSVDNDDENSSPYLAALRADPGSKGSYVDFTVGELKTLPPSAGGQETAGEKIIWKIAQRDTFSMASGGAFHLARAYRKDNQLFFLVWFHHFNHHAGGSDADAFLFTPIFTLAAPRPL